MINISEQNYRILFEEKKSIFSDAFKDIKSKKYFQSPSHSFRYRAEFSVIKIDNVLFFAMTKDGKKEVVTTFPIASHKIQTLMSPVLEHLRENLQLSDKLFQIEFQSSRNEDVMMTIIYHKDLDEEWIRSATNLSANLKLSVIGRSRKQKIIIGDDFVTESYKYLNEQFSLKLYEQCFSQTNPYVCDSMINWVAENVTDNSHDIIELHCGLGTFTIPLSSLFKKVLATENSRPSIRALNENIRINNKTNIFHARLSGKETLEAFFGVRKFRRLAEIDLNKFNINTIFLDPPREGLDQNTLDSLKEMKNVIYISCGFESFKRDLRILQETHEIINLAMFDQFPYTDHIESGAILRRITPD